jgi:putative ABC transport system substrate-binding protein
MRQLVAILWALLLAACGAVLPASPKAPAVIGVIQGVPPDLAKPRIDALRVGLDALGYREGRDITFELRYLEGKGEERATELAQELIQKGAAVIVTGNPAGVEGARHASSAIPIVMAGVGVDPVGHGWISSLARPGGNITGLSFQVPTSPGKRLQLLKEIVPSARRIGVLHDATSPPSVRPEIEDAARSLGFELEVIAVKNAGEIEAAFEAFRSARITAALVTVGGVTPQHFERIATLAIAHRIATVSGVLESVRSGGLVAFAPEQADLYRRAAGYVDKILKGAKPGDLPVQQPEKFELVINMKTAEAIGITVPGSVLAQATEVIR